MPGLGLVIHLAFKVDVAEVDKKHCSSKTVVGWMEWGMFNVNNYKRLPNSDRRIGHNKLLIKENYTITTQPGSARRWVLLAGVVLLAGLSNSLQAFPENTQSGYAESSLDLNFSATAPITLSRMVPVGRSGINGTHSVTLEYDLDSEVAAVDSTTAAKLSDYVPPKITLAWDNNSNATQPLSRESEFVALGAQRVMPAKVAQDSVNKLAGNINAAPSESEDNPLQVDKPRVEEVVRSPFVTIALAVLALLGLVSVARRNDI